MGPSRAPARRFDALVTGLVTSRLLGRAFRRRLTVVTYTGRRSGRVVSTPVAYRRRGDGRVEIRVGQPEGKAWWRNFTGEGAALTLLLDGAPCPGHGIATRDARGATLVTVTLARSAEDDGPRA